MSSADTPDRFRDDINPDDQGVGENYGTYNISSSTKVRCPACGRVVIVPVGQFDATHDCTILCPYSGDLMQPIPADPTSAGVNLIPKTSVEVAMDGWVQYFYYCPSKTCSYFLQQHTAFVQKRVLTELFVGR